MAKFDERKIDRLQENLTVLRKVAGWSAEDLANMIGVTRQTIINLEKGSNYRMTKIQYIAIRSVLEAETRENQNDTLGKLIEILVDSAETPEESKNKVRKTVAVATSSVSKRTGSAAAGMAAVQALIPLLGTLGPPIMGTAMFASELLKDKKGIQQKSDTSKDGI